MKLYCDVMWQANWTIYKQVNNNTSGTYTQPEFSSKGFEKPYSADYEG